MHYYNYTFTIIVYTFLRFHYLGKKYYCCNRRAQSNTILWISLNRSIQFPTVNKLYIFMLALVLWN